MPEQEAEWEQRRQMSRLASELEGEARQLGLPRSSLVTLLQRLHALGVLTFDALPRSSVDPAELMQAIEAAGMRVVRR